MIERVSFYLKRRKIERWMQAISRSSDEAYRKARADGASRERLDELAAEYFMESDFAKDEMIDLASSHYTKLAHRLLVPVPKFTIDEGGAWTQSHISGKYHLKLEALHALRASIQAEEKARREGWIVWASLFMGMFGTLAAFVSALTAFIKAWP